MIEKCQVDSKSDGENNDSSDTAQQLNSDDNEESVSSEENKDDNSQGDMNMKSDSNRSHYMSDKKSPNGANTD